MTVDSKYTPESFTNGGQTHYPSQIENADGDYLVLIKVSDSERLVLDQGYHYNVVEPEVQSPYNYRCDLQLAAPIASNAYLQILRKTPIQTEFDPVPQRPFNATSLEYELDIICFIQQELEGHLCDCRSDLPAYPGEPEIPELPPRVDPRPECQPYDCNAFVKEAAAAGLNVADFREVEVLTEVPDYWQWYDGGGDGIWPGGYVGLPIYQGFSTLNAHFTFDLDGQIDACDDRTVGLGLGNSPPATPIGAKFHFNQGGVTGVTLVQGALSHVNAFQTYFRRYVTWDSPGFTGQFNLGIAFNNTQGFTTITLGTVIGNPVQISGMNLVVAECYLANFREEEQSPNNFVIMGDAVHIINFNGVQYKAIVPVQMTAPGVGSAPGFSNIQYEDPYMFIGLVSTVYAAIGHTEEVTEEDISDMQLWLARNYEDYDPPDYCGT